MSEWEVWLKLVEAPKTGTALEAPPAVILSPDGARFRCGRCGAVLMVAPFGAAKGFVVHCAACDRYNSVSV